MKVLYISYDGATEPIAKSQIVPYLERLTNKGVSCTLLSFDKKRYIPRRMQFDYVKSEFQEKAIHWISLRYHKTPTALATGWDILCGIAVSLYVCIKERINIVHARSYVAALIALCVKVLCRKKFIFDMRGYWADERVEGYLWPEHSLLYKIAKRLEKVFVCQADFIVVLTKNMQSRLSQDYKIAPERIAVIPTCVDLEKFHIVPPDTAEDSLFGSVKQRLENKAVLIYVGSLGTVYMLEAMFDFFALLKARVEKMHFLLLSHSDTQAAYAAAEQKAIPEDEFTLISSAHDSVRTWLNLAKIGIAFYRPAFSAIGRAPTKIGEYLACGIPVVVNKGVGDIDQIVVERNIGVVVDSLDEPGYLKAAAALERLIEQPDLKERCRRVAQEYFSLEKGSDDYFKVYQTVMNQKSGKRN
ncbi:MAG: glycosyltransferase family 4 protein [Candidatus Omnitrophota bacterium]